MKNDVWTLDLPAPSTTTTLALITTTVVPTTTKYYYWVVAGRTRGKSFFAYEARAHSSLAPTRKTSCNLSSSEIPSARCIAR